MMLKKLYSILKMLSIEMANCNVPIMEFKFINFSKLTLFAGRSLETTKL